MESVNASLNIRAKTEINAFFTPRQYNVGTTVDFKIFRDAQGVGVGNIQSETIRPGGLLYSTLSGGTPVAYAPFTSSISTNQFCLDEQFVTFYGYLFLPQGLGAFTGSSLYSTIGDVDYNFSVVPGDILQFVASSVTYNFEIASVTITPGVTGSVCFTTATPIPNSLSGNFNSVTQTLFLRKNKDETSIILNYIKPTGKTSYGFIIPDNISAEVLDNIDTITSQVKQKLINEQSVIDNISGGGF
jgi:hypothetical protein